MTPAYSSQFAKENNVNIAIVLIYVDDLVIMGDDLKEVTWIYEILLIRFEMRGLGELKHFLSLEIDHWDKGVFLYQHKYATDFLNLQVWDGKLQTKLNTNRSEQ